MMESTPLYSLRPADVYQALETSPAGLPTDELAARRALYGPNLLSEPQAATHWKVFFEYLRHPMTLLLWAAGGLAFIVNEPTLGGVIWVLGSVNAVFSLWREYRAEQAMVALRQLLPSTARVIRDGTELQVPALDLVPGDVLVLAEGDNVPADARLVEEYGLRTNNATLTGEAVPARKIADASLQEGMSEVERPNLIFTGTSIVSGTGKAVVFATGMLTQFGRIASLTQAAKEAPSPIQNELDHIRKVLSVAALATGLVVFGVGSFDVGLGLLEAFILALGIIVAVIPEGLPAIITLSLAMAGQRLAQHGILVKKLAAIETLGNVSIICTDKSGTLTQNQMTVREIWVGGQRLSVSGVGYQPDGDFSPDPRGSAVESDLSALLEAASLCNNSRLNAPTPDHPTWSSLGDQTEAALRVAALKDGVQEKELGRQFPRIHEIPFDARRKRMCTIHRTSAGETAFVKGAPREVLQLCSHFLQHGEVRPITPEARAAILAANDDYARNALRVMAVARRKLPEDLTGPYRHAAEMVERDLIFLGLTAMMDPPRAEVAEAVKICRQAGIRMVMITGDYGLTAESLARRVGMLASANPSILTGAELDALNDQDLQALLKDQEVIFARMAPEHKLRLVATFQEMGEVVAVTGDGVNDAPALRKADIGIAMGQTGTDVAKEAADLVLTDDNFAKIVTAISEGRSVFENLRKFITYIFSSNVPEVVPFLLTALTHIPLALTVRQILAIDLGTDVLPALALGTDNPEPDVMSRPPRRQTERLINAPVMRRSFLWLGPIETILCYTGFFFVYYFVGGIDFLHLTLDQWKNLPELMSDVQPQIQLLAVTVFHAGVVTVQAGNAFACRTASGRGRRLGWFSNPYLWGGVVSEIGIIFALVYFPPLADWFDHQPIPPVYWVGLSAYAPIIYGLDWVRKRKVHQVKAIQPDRLQKPILETHQEGDTRP